MTDASDRTIREVLNRYDEAFNAPTRVCGRTRSRTIA
jgi:hypothetical protein